MDTDQMSDRRNKMKIYRIISILSIVFMCMIFCEISYADQIDSSYETYINLDMIDRTKERISNEERNNLLSIENFTVKSNADLNKNNISLYRYSDLEGDYVSFREIIELIGGNITWEGPLNENKDFNYGYIYINNKKYEYQYAAKDPYVLNNRITFITLFETKENGKKMELPATINGPLTIKIKDNALLLPANQIMDIYNRWGYIYTFDLNNNIFYVKEFDMIKENKMIKQILPESSSRMYYDSEDTIDITEALNIDFYYNICALTETANLGIWRYFDTEYKPYEVVADYEKRCKMCYKGFYSIETDDSNISVKYNEDLDCYIAYNNRCSEGDPAFKMIAVRKFDGQIVYAYY